LEATAFLKYSASLNLLVIRLTTYFSRSTGMSFVCAMWQKTIYVISYHFLHIEDRKRFAFLRITETAISLHDTLLAASTYFRSNMPQSSLKYRQTHYHNTISVDLMKDNSKHIQHLKLLENFVAFV